MERSILVPASVRHTYDWNQLGDRESFSFKRLQRLTDCSFDVKQYSNDLYITVIAGNEEKLDLGVTEIDNIIWNQQRKNSFEEQLEVQSVPADLFQDMATEPADIFALHPAMAFQDEDQKGPGEIVWLPQEKLGLILGKKHKTLLEIRTLTNTEIKMEENEGGMTKFLLWGKEDDKQRAKVMLAEAMQHIPPLHPGQVTEMFDIPQTMIGHIIGPQGSMIKALQGKACCFIKVFDDARIMVRGEPERVIEGVALVRKMADLPPIILSYDKKNQKNEGKGDGPPGIDAKPDLTEKETLKGALMLNTEKAMKLVVPPGLADKLTDIDLTKLESEFGVRIGCGFLPDSGAHEVLIEGQVGVVKACKMRLDRILNTKLKEDIEMLALPNGWKVFTDPNSNRPYYHYTPTGHTTWNHPLSEEYKAEYERVQAQLPKKKEEPKAKKVAVTMRPNRKRKAKGDEKLPQIVNIIRADGKMIVKRPREPEQELQRQTLSSGVGVQNMDTQAMNSQAIVESKPSFIGPAPDPYGPELATANDPNMINEETHVFEPMPKRKPAPKPKKKTKPPKPKLNVQEEAILAVLREKKKRKLEQASAAEPEAKRVKRDPNEFMLSKDRQVKEPEQPLTAPAVPPGMTRIPPGMSSMIPPKNNTEEELPDEKIS